MKAKTKVNLDDIYKPLHSTGAPFFGLLRIKPGLAKYPVNLDPDYQRGHVWTVEQQEAFVGHLIEGGEVQPCIVNDGPRGQYPVAELVDGKQRVTACIRWADGEIAARLWDGQRIWANDLDDVSRAICKLNVGLRFAIVQLTRAECLTLYIRLNRGGTPHTTEEIERVRELLRAEQEA